MLGVNKTLTMKDVVPESTLAREVLLVELSPQVLVYTIALESSLIHNLSLIRLVTVNLELLVRPSLYKDLEM